MAKSMLTVIILSSFILGGSHVSANQVADAAKKRAKENCSDTLIKLKEKYKTNSKALKYVNNIKTKKACEDAMYVQMGSCSKSFYKEFNNQIKDRKLSSVQLTQLSQPLAEKMKVCMAKSILQTSATIEKAALETSKM